MKRKNQQLDLLQSEATSCLPPSQRPVLRPECRMQQVRQLKSNVTGREHEVSAHVNGACLPGGLNVAEAVSLGGVRSGAIPAAKTGCSASFVAAVA